MSSPMSGEFPEKASIREGNTITLAANVSSVAARTGQSHPQEVGRMFDRGRVSDPSHMETPTPRDEESSVSAS